MRTASQTVVAIIVFQCGVGFELARAQDPVLVGTWSRPEGASWAFKVAASGSYAYVADFDYGLQVIDVSNPASPVRIGQYKGSSLPSRGVAVSANYAYLTETRDGLAIIDVSNPGAPTRVGRIVTTGVAQGVAVSGNYAYVAVSDKGLEVIDISNPAAPIRTGMASTDMAWDVASLNGYAYVADGDTGLKIIDVRNPAAPVQVGAFATGGWVYGVAVNGRHVYVGANDAGLQVIDVSNPAAPVRIATVPSSSLYDEVAVAGKYAYVADYNFGVDVIDISEPAAPRRLGSYSTGGRGNRGVAVSGDYVYGVGWNGLAIFRHEQATRLTVQAAASSRISLAWEAGSAVRLQKAATLTNSLWETVPLAEANTIELSVTEPRAFFRLLRLFPLEIQIPPKSQQVRAGSNALFTVTARGTGDLKYQWRRDAVDIVGATNSSVLLPNTRIADEGVYTVRVSDEQNTLVSSGAVLSVLVRPAITQQPQSQTVSIGETLNLSVSIEGHPPPFGYRWRRNGILLTNMVSSEKTSAFMIANVQTNHAGSYDVVITNAALFLPGIRSSNAVLTVLQP